MFKERKVKMIEIYDECCSLVMSSKRIKLRFGQILEIFLVVVTVKKQSLTY